MDRITRRAAVAAGAAGMAVAGAGRAAAVVVFSPQPPLCRTIVRPIFWQGVFATLLGGIAAGWFIEVLKNYGFIPGSQAAVIASVDQHHTAEQATINSQGFDVDPIYQGPYSLGDVAISDATRGDDYFAFSSSDHASGDGYSTCTLAHLLPDICAYHATTSVLRAEGYPKNLIESCALPIHGAKYGAYDDFGHTSWRSANTPNGVLEWRAHQDEGDLKVQARICGSVNAKISAVREPGRWKYAYDEA
jgi:hypothetical protein